MTIAVSKGCDYFRGAAMWFVLPMASKECRTYSPRGHSLQTPN